MKCRSCLISTLDGGVWSALPFPGLTSGKEPAIPVTYSRFYVYFAIQAVCNVIYIEVLSYVRVIVVCMTGIFICKKGIVCKQYHDTLISCVL